MKRRRKLITQETVGKLEVRADNTARLTCDDGNGKVLVVQEIEYTDFPAALTGQRLWLENGTLMLPEER